MCLGLKYAELHQANRAKNQSTIEKEFVEEKNIER